MVSLTVILFGVKGHYARRRPSDELGGAIVSLEEGEVVVNQQAVDLVVGDRLHSLSDYGLWLCIKRLERSQSLL